MVQIFKLATTFLVQNIFCYITLMIVLQVKSVSLIAAKAEAAFIGGGAAANVTFAPHLSAADPECDGEESDIDIDNV